MQVMDLYGRPMTPPKKAELEDEIAGAETGSVRTIQAGHPADGLTPARLGMILREAETGDATAYLELAEQMEEKDLHYAAVLGVRKRAIRAMELHVEPAGDSRAEKDAAELVRETLSGSAVKDDLIDMLDALGKGYSVTEILWDTKRNLWKVRELKWRDPRWFKFDDVNGDTLLLRGNEGNVPLQPGKFISHRAKAKSGLTIRSGLARLAAWAYVFKNYTLKDWAVFMEAYGHPLRIGRYGTNATPNDRATLLRAVRRVGTDMAAIIPKSMDMEIINANVTGAGPLYESSAKYWDQQISKGVLGQVSTTDAIAGGHAVGKVHDQVRDDIRDADAEQLAMTLQRDVAGPLTAWNFGPDAGVPRISLVPPEEHDPRLLAIAAKEFVPMGLKIPLSVVQKRFGIPDPQDGEAVLKAPVQPSVEVPGAGEAEAVETAAAQQPQASSLDAMIDELMGNGRAAEATDPMLGGIMEAIQGAGSLEQVRDILEEFAERAPDEQLRELIAQVMFAARVAGESGADVGATA